MLKAEILCMKTELQCGFDLGIMMNKHVHEYVSEKGLLWQNYHTVQSIRNYSLKDVQLSKYASFYVPDSGENH